LGTEDCAPSQQFDLQIKVDCSEQADPKTERAQTESHTFLIRNSPPLRRINGRIASGSQAPQAIPVRACALTGTSRRGGDGARHRPRLRRLRRPRRLRPPLALMPPLVISDEDLDVLLQEDQSACRNGRLHYGRRKGADGDDGHRGLARNGRDPGGKRRL